MLSHDTSNEKDVRLNPKTGSRYPNRNSVGFEALIFSAVGITVLVAFSGLMNRTAMGGTDEFPPLNLGRS